MKIAKKQLQPLGTSTEVSVQEKAFLMQGTRKIPIYAECASKYSLSFRYLAEKQLNISDEPINLLIRNNGQVVELGPCRILSDPDENGHPGRLVFLNDVYDIHRLLKEKKVVDLPSAFHDLPIILARKEKIHQSFKEYTADLSYDLSVYKRFFDDLDSQYHKEPAEVRNAIQKVIIETEGKEFRRFFETKLSELKNLVNNYSQKEHQRHGYYFKKQIWNFILDCPFTARAMLKPKGYAGDYGLMQMIYSNDYEGDSTFSKLTHKHAVEHAAAHSVRNRISLIAKMIDNYQKSNHLLSQGKIKVLSVGCGPAFELQKILKSPQDAKKYHFTMFDQDPDALSAVAKLIDDIGIKLSVKPKIAYVKGSVRNMLFSMAFEQKWGQFDVIYSMGLFDYLTSRVAKAVLGRLFHLLKPGGELIVGNFHVSNPSKYYMAYWGDWSLILRTEEEFKSLFQNTSSGKCSVIYDDTGYQMFLHIRKYKDLR